MTGTPTGGKYPAPPRLTANPAPPRRPGSVRRTTSIDVEWPDGRDGNRLFHGRAREIWTPQNGASRVLAEARMEATIDDERIILALAAEPAPPQLPRLVGLRGGGHLRMAMADLMPELIADGAPLYLLLDDISGLSLIAGWGMAVWTSDWQMADAKINGGAALEEFLTTRTNICWGFQPGHSSLDPDHLVMHNGSTDGGELRNPVDPDGWHAFPSVVGASMRRARRIEVWRDADSGLIHVDSAFQDSAPRPDNSRAALHEYGLAATLDPATHALLSLEAMPRVLPFHECPGAVANTKQLLGTPLTQIREAVLDRLRGPAGCTHLNDALRALGEVPALLRRLPD